MIFFPEASDFVAESKESGCESHLEEITVNCSSAYIVKMCEKENNTFQRSIMEAARINRIWISVGIHELGETSNRMWNSHLGIKLYLDVKPYELRFCVQ